MSNQSWLRDGIFRDSQSRILIPGIQDRDSLFWAKSKNPENPKIPKSRGSRSGFQNLEEIPKIPKSPESGLIFSGIFFQSRNFYSQDFLKIPGIYPKFPEFVSPGFGIFIPGIFFVGWDIPTKSQLWCLTHKYMYKDINFNLTYKNWAFNPNVVGRISWRVVSPF